MYHDGWRILGPAITEDDQKAAIIKRLAKNLNISLANTSQLGEPNTATTRDAFQGAVWVNARDGSLSVSQAPFKTPERNVVNSVGELFATHGTLNEQGRIMYTQKPETQQQVIDRLLNDW